MMSRKVGPFCWSGQLYLVWKQGDFKLGLSHKPGLDCNFWADRGYEGSMLLTAPLPLGIAFFLWERLNSSLVLTETSIVKVKQRLAEEIKKSLEFLKRAAGIAKHPNSVTMPVGIPIPAAADNWPPSAQVELVRRALKGRILYREEVAVSVAEIALQPLTPVEDLLQVLILLGAARILPAIGFDRKGEPFCNRCGQVSGLRLTFCAACGGPCFICEECASMGEARSCRPLYASPGDEPATPVRVRPTFNFQLTPAQERAAAELEDFVRRRSSRECLLWAACGAGKTEVAFRAIGEALGRGIQVLYATPRRAVVQELAPRLGNAFTEEQVVALYGGSTRKYGRAPLTLATTHQALRHFRRFGLVVLDEGDAFPFRQSPMLHYAVDRASLEGGQIIYLTATPPEELLRRLRREKGEIVYLPARHHGHPLPEPQLWSDSRLDARRPERLPREVEGFLRLSREEDGAQILVFVPSVELVAEIAAALAGRFKFGAGGVAGCSAADPKREEKLAAFRRREIEVLVTTTLMERGLTLERINVLVLFADVETIFDVNTLVQIAGRVGRTLTYPNGRVWFIGRRISPFMAEARKRIREFNRMAAAKGYLLPGTYK